MPRKCYPYIRFSHKKQELGTSVARQGDIHQFIEKHSLIVDTTLEDLGVSAFRGKNAKKGQLGGFIDLVEQGLIEPNSILLIENFDRLSRQKVIKSTQIFINLLNHGVDIAILDTGKIYSRDALHTSDFFLAIIEFERANAESARKSDFVSSAWTQYRAEMRATKAPKTRKTPSWIGVEGTIRTRPGEAPTARFVVIEKEARKIRKIFELALSRGSSEVARSINDWLEPDEPRYSLHQIQYLLKNRKVIGEHQPQKMGEDKNGDLKLAPEGGAILNYYPAIVDRTIFDEVQEQIKNRKPFAGRFNATRLNIFAGLISCGHCNGTIRFMDKSNAAEPGKKQYLICTNSMTGKCVIPHRLTYEFNTIVWNVFRTVDKLNLSEVFQNDEAILKLNISIKDEEKSLADIEKQLTRFKNQLLEMLTGGKEISDTFNQMLIEIEKKKMLHVANLKTLTDQKNLQVEQSEASKNFSRENILTLMNDRSDEGTRSRIKLNYHLSKLIRSIRLTWTKKPSGKRGIGDPSIGIFFTSGTYRGIQVGAAQSHLKSE